MILHYCALGCNGTVPTFRFDTHFFNSKAALTFPPSSPTPVVYECKQFTTGSLQFSFVLNIMSLPWHGMLLSYRSHKPVLRSWSAIFDNGVSLGDCLQLCPYCATTKSEFELWSNNYSLTTQQERTKCYGYLEIWNQKPTCTRASL